MVDATPEWCSWTVGWCAWTSGSHRSLQSRRWSPTAHLNTDRLCYKTSLTSQLLNLSWMARCLQWRVDDIFEPFSCVEVNVTDTHLLNCLKYWLNFFSTWNLVDILHLGSWMCMQSFNVLKCLLQFLYCGQLEPHSIFKLLEILVKLIISFWNLVDIIH